MKHCVPHTNADVNEFYRLYYVHRDAFQDILCSHAEYRPFSVDGISDQNYAALELTFLVGEMLADLDDDSGAA